jgi:hypothetical protein
VVARQQWHSSLGIPGVSIARDTEFGMAFVAFVFLIGIPGSFVGRNLASTSVAHHLGTLWDRYFMGSPCDISCDDYRTQSWDEGDVAFGDLVLCLWHDTRMGVISKIETFSRTLRMIRIAHCLLVLSLLAFGDLFNQRGFSGDYAVASDQDLVRTIRQAKAGDVIVIAPGAYRGGLSFQGLRGTEKEPIVIRGEDARFLPQIVGGKEGVQFSGCSHVVLEDIDFSGQRENGINIDDVTSSAPIGADRSEGMVLRRVSVTLVPKDENYDGIKLSGLKNFLVEDCRIQGWSSNGCGIDMVGCYSGSIRGCVLDGQSKGQVGIQAKGGSESIEITDCLIKDSVDRGIQIGGATDLSSFRDDNAIYEARDVQVSRCTIVGGETSIAMTGSHNTTINLSRLLYPKRWFFKAIRENPNTRFLNTSKGLITKNVCVARGRDFVGSIRVDSGVDKHTIYFQENVWCCEDNPARDLRIGLPVHDSTGIVAQRPAYVFLREDLVWNENRHEMVLEQIREIRGTGKGDVIGRVFRWSSLLFFTVALFASVWLSAYGPGRTSFLPPRILIVSVCILLSFFLVALMLIAEFDAMSGAKIDINQSVRRLFYPSNKLTSEEQWISILDGTFVFLTSNTLACVAYLSTQDKSKRIVFMSGTIAATIVFCFFLKLLFFPSMGIDGFATVYFFLIAIPFGAYTVFAWNKEGGRRLTRVQSMLHRRHPVQRVYLLAIFLLVVGVLLHLILGGIRFDPYVIGSWLRHQYWNWMPKPFRYGWTSNSLGIDHLILLPAAVLVWKWSNIHKGLPRRMGQSILSVFVVAMVIECLKLFELLRYSDLGVLGINFLIGSVFVLVMEIIQRLLDNPVASRLSYPRVAEVSGYILTIAAWVTLIIYCI